jgi:hypothetical protein
MRILPTLAMLIVALPALPAWSGCQDSDDDKDEATLAVEPARDPSSGADELLVSVQGSAAEDPGAASSGGAVGLECLDAAGKTTVAARHPWPFEDEPGYPLPHVHQPASPRQIEATVRCRLTGTRFPIEGGVRGRGG